MTDATRSGANKASPSTRPPTDPEVTQFMLYNGVKMPTYPEVFEHYRALLIAMRERDAEYE